MATLLLLGSAYILWKTWLAIERDATSDILDDIKSDEDNEDTTKEYAPDAPLKKEAPLIPNEERNINQESVPEEKAKQAMFDGFTAREDDTPQIKIPKHMTSISNGLGYDRYE